MRMILIVPLFPFLHNPLFSTFRKLVFGIVLWKLVSKIALHIPQTNFQNVKNQSVPREKKGANRIF